MATTITVQAARQHLQKGELEVVAQILQAYPIRDQHLSNICLLVLSQFSVFSEEYLMETIDYKEAEVRRNRIIRKFQTILIRIEQTEPPFDPAYKMGNIKLSVGNYEAAKALFAGIDPNDGNYALAYHNKCIAAFATATTPEEREALLSDLDNLEVLLLRSTDMDIELLISFLYNRSEILKSLGYPQLAKNDLEKLRLLGSDLGLEPV